MNSLTLVPHCFKYPRVLCFQLSSFVLHKPPPGFELALVTADDDQPVRDVVEFFRPQFTFPFHDVVLPRNECCRRSIGRNLVSKRATTDWVWHADADFLFGPGAIAAAMQALASLPERVLFSWPSEVLGSRDPGGNHSRGANQETSKDHEAGDSEIARCTPPILIDVRPELYGPMALKFGIGGAQIARGSFLREHGYLADSRKHQTPVTDGEWPRERTPEDKAFRGQFKPEQRMSIAVPELRRLRHSNHGGLNGVVNL